MKVYVITKGTYSDYYICGVALTKERAEEICRLKTDWYESAQIEEYDTDDIQANEYKQMWKCDRAKDGTWKAKSYYDEINRIEYGTFGLCDYNYKTRRCETDYDVFYAYVAADDEEHALKIAQDMYAQKKAEALEL